MLSKFLCFLVELLNLQLITGQQYLVEFLRSSWCMGIKDTANENNKITPSDAAQAMVQKLQASMEFAQTMQEYANKKRTSSPQFKVRDKVWLSLKNIVKIQQLKKLDWKMQNLQ